MITVPIHEHDLGRSRIGEVLAHGLSAAQAGIACSQDEYPIADRNLLAWRCRRVLGSHLRLLSLRSIVPSIGDLPILASSTVSNGEVIPIPAHKLIHSGYDLVCCDTVSWEC